MNRIQQITVDRLKADGYEVTGRRGSLVTLRKGADYRGVNKYGQESRTQDRGCGRG